MTLPTDSDQRKDLPMATGLLDYFPDALAEVADVSRVGNEKHNAGQPLHWSKHLSADHADCLIRHFVERGFRDTDGCRHRAKVAWRALADLQMELEAEENGMSYDAYIALLKTQAATLPVTQVCLKCAKPLDHIGPSVYCVACDRRHFDVVDGKTITWRDADSDPI